MAKAKDLNKLKPHDSAKLVTKFTYCSIVYKIHDLVKTICRQLTVSREQCAVRNGLIRTSQKGYPIVA